MDYQTQQLIRLLSETLREIYKVSGVEMPDRIYPSILAREIYKAIEKKVIEEHKKKVEI